MKCPRCWSDKAYIRQNTGFQRLLLKCVLLVPMKCQHCYHKFTVSWFATIGKQMYPPILRIAPISQDSRPSHAAKYYAAMQNQHEPGVAPHVRSSRRADAA